MQSFEAFKQEWNSSSSVPLTEAQLAICRQSYRQHIESDIERLHFERLDAAKTTSQLEQVLQTSFQHGDVATPRTYVFVYPAFPAPGLQRWTLALTPGEDGYSMQYDVFDPPTTPGGPEQRRTTSGKLGVALGHALQAAITTQVTSSRPKTGKWHVLDGSLFFLFTQVNGQWRAARTHPVEDDTPPGKLAAILETLVQQAGSSVSEAALLADLQALEQMAAAADAAEAQALQLLKALDT
ncbi:hypothetical protein DCC81_08350 [Chitinophaga parva]|uniref:Uncharacterized protein n=1 Tax=Chitinophaga parva TaxID=2169414 RepID=A0A2T7BP40_9BACT|nr:hypothetical protein [Chitinophaga parva]PUZ29445.1 hypothetical protein DCC81_08350 [Chitinophaga parva]